ncbi:MAG: secretion protein [Bacteroidetes bacterium]|nr:MAG: secretion protein [Bacteroidota bacterium]
MIKFFKAALLLCVVSCISFEAAAQQSYWSQYNDATTLVPDKAVKRKSFPGTYKLFGLNIIAFRQQLFSIVGDQAQHSTIITIPNVQGEMEQFEVYEASNFEQELQTRFPDIRAFSGKGITDKQATLKLSISPQGVQSMIFRTGTENEFVEPYSQDHSFYAVFNSVRKKGELPWTCSTQDQRLLSGISTSIQSSNIILSSAGELKTMRLAQSVTAEYSNYFGATSAAQVALVLAAVNATLTRSNGVYEKDLALHLNLIANTTNVFYYNPATDPYSDPATGSGGAWNGEVQNTLTSVIGEANYDIGHLFGDSGGGGNAGCIGCVCVNGQKGSGFTSPSDGIPQGDNFDIDYVVHEIGHQLGANHTFSYAIEGTGVNKEVGSGITIMGYAGITDQDVAPHSIAYYHQASIAQIQANLATKTCPVTVNISATNATPVVNAGSDYTIPISTPFALTGSATDANPSDVLTYSWEQNDNANGTQTGNASVASATKATGPNWISFSPTTSPTRLFPKLSTILAGQLISGPLPGGDAIANTEALSSVSRTLNFRLTARDNAPFNSTVPQSVGQSQFDDIVVTVTNTSGPFQITSPNTSVIWTGGSAQTITWDVANTTAAPVSCANVKISLSTDGGNTFTTLLASTPNDGTQSVTLPALPTTFSTCRIKVESVGNIFFDINNTNFTITAPDIQFEFSGDTQKEITNTTAGCRNYKDYIVNMKTNQPLAGSGTAVITINPSVSSTAILGTDYDFTTNGNFATPGNTLSFTVGGSTILPLTLRIYDDASVETTEFLTLTYSLAAGSTNAVTGTENQTYTFTITDNDIAPHVAVTPLATIGSGNTTFMHPFRGEFNDARTQILLTSSELMAAGFYDGTISNFTEMALNVVSKNSTIPYNGLTIKMKNTTTTSLDGGAFETGTTTVFGPVSYSTIAGINNFVLTTPFAWDSTKNLLIEICYNNGNGGGGNSEADSVATTITSVLNMHYDRTATSSAAGCTLPTANFISSFRPNVRLKQQPVAETPVETVLNSTKTIYLGPFADVYFYSSADNELMTRIQNLTSFDYGCTQVTVDRAGNTSAQFWNNDASNYLLSKSIKVVPTNNTTAGNYQITLYYTGAEVSGWQVPTGRLFANNQIIKVSNGFNIPDVTPSNVHLDDVTIAGATAGTTGTTRSIKSEFKNTGFSGFGAGYPCSPLSGEVFWTGAVNTDWFNTGNWACGVLPGPTTDVRISNGLVNYPVITGNPTIKSLTLNTGASCIVNPGFTLTLTGL